MTTTANPTPPSAAVQATGPRRPGRMVRAGVWLRRWHRLVIPASLAVVLLTGTSIAHALQGVDVADADYLSPTSHADIGGADLAGRLTVAGVTVRRVVTGHDVLSAGFAGNVTLFLPAAKLLRPDTLVELRQMPPSTRIVVVAPDSTTLDAMALPTITTTDRWATNTVAPGCDLPYAVAAGAAGVDAREYTIDDTVRGAGSVSCYHGGLTRVVARSEILIVGASDPFRNDRLTESGNAALATGLLGGGTVVWLDIHQAEPPPTAVDGPPAGTPDPRSTITPGPTSTPSGRPSGADGGGGGGGGDNSDAKQLTIADLFPSWLWALVGLVILTGLALAAARARRLGPPVVEPLPVAARGRETIEGRARLYQRARQPAAALHVLRGAALDQIPALVGLTSRATTDELVAAVAAHTGCPAATVRAILIDDDPDSDAALLAATSRLDELMTALHGPQAGILPDPPEPDSTEGEHR